jgi:hypothetical protein
VNDVIREGANPLANIDGIHWLLTQTTLRRAPLWLLGSDDPQQEAIEATQDRSPEAQYALGIRALVARQYAPAASFFAEADRQGLTAPAVRALWAYALCLQNRADLARELAGHVAPAAADERHFWTWLSATFGVSPTIHAVP